MTRRDILVGGIGAALGLGGCKAATRSSAKQTATVTPQSENIGLNDTSTNYEVTAPKLEIEDIRADSRVDPFTPTANEDTSKSVSGRKGDADSDAITMDLDAIALEIANNIVRFKTNTAGQRLRITGYIAGITVESESIWILIHSDYKSIAAFCFSKDFESKVAVLDKGHTVTLDGYYDRSEKVNGHDCPLFDGVDVVSTSPSTYVSPEDRFASAWTDMMLSTLKAAAESANR
jgi:hypothetical protein